MGERLDYPSVSHISSVAQVQFHHQIHCRRLVTRNNFKHLKKHLVKLDSVSPPSRMATSTLCLQSRRTMSRHTRLLPGIYWKRLLLTKKWETFSQRDSRPSACCSVGTRCNQHHQCGGGRLRRHHHLHPGGDYSHFPTFNWGREGGREPILVDIISCNFKVGSLGTNERIGVQFLTDCNQGGQERSIKRKITHHLLALWKIFVSWFSSNHPGQ